jgi:transketolase
MAGIISTEQDKIATRVAYGKALLELGKENPNIVVLDADLSSSTQTKFFAQEFPDRFFNMGIAEANMISVAAGLARAGKIPFASSFAMFATGRAWEQVRNSVAHNHVNVKICASHAGLTVGEDGASHQTIEDLAIMRVIPTMTVIVPADATETRLATRAIAKYEGPVYMRLGRSSVPVLFGDTYQFEIGKANLIKSGSDITIVACGIMLSQALEAAQQLEKEKNISVELINCASIKPLDKETILKSVSKTGRVVTAEEHNIIGGLGDAVASAILEGSDKKVRLKKIGIHDCFGQSGTAEALLDYYGLTANSIKEAAYALIN